MRYASSAGLKKTAIQKNQYAVLPSFTGQKRPYPRKMRSNGAALSDAIIQRTTITTGAL